MVTEAHKDDVNSVDFNLSMSSSWQRGKDKVAVGDLVRELMALLPVLVLALAAHVLCFRILLILCHASFQSYTFSIDSALCRYLILF